MVRTRPGVKYNIYSDRFGSVHCIHTTAFRKCIRDYLIAKGRTETRIASGFRNPESLMALRKLPLNLVFDGRWRKKRGGAEAD